MPTLVGVFELPAAMARASKRPMSSIALLQIDLF